MGLSDIVTIDISTTEARVERQGFGMPLILAHDVPVGFTERIRIYSDMTGVAVDFASGATFNMANAIFSQNPKPVQIAIGRVTPATQKFLITPVVANSTKYVLTFNGNVLTYTSDSSATAQEINTGLKALIDALSLGVTVSLQNTNTQMQILANAAGAAFDVTVGDPSVLGIVQNHADPGVSADLTAINTANSSWYAIVNTLNSTAMVLAIAVWVEANDKLFIAQTQESAVVTVAFGSDDPSTGSIAAQMKSHNYFRSALIYHPQTQAYADGAWCGRVLPLDPGSETWALKTLAGVATPALTETQHENAINKMCNTYEAYAGVSVTGVGDQTLGGMGRVCGNEFIDVIRFRDWLENTMQADIFTALANAPGKIPQTDGGVSVIEGIILADLQAGVDVGGLSANPPPKVTVPTVASMASADKQNRKLTPINFDAVLAGAIQAVNASGSVHT